MRITNRILAHMVSEFSGDLLQDLTLKLLELPGDAPEFETQLDLEKWVAKIAGNLYKNDKWKEDNRARILEANEEDIRDVYDYNSSAADPLDMIVAEELENELLGNLSDLEKEIYTLVLGQGVPYKAVALKLHMSEAAVRKHVSRIKAKFNGKTNQNEQAASPIHKAAGN